VRPYREPAKGAKAPPHEQVRTSFDPRLGHHMRLTLNRHVAPGVRIVYLARADADVLTGTERFLLTVDVDAEAIASRTSAALDGFDAAAREVAYAARKRGRFLRRGRR
jgi:hypothetical protein